MDWLAARRIGERSLETVQGDISKLPEAGAPKGKLQALAHDALAPSWEEPQPIENTDGWTSSDSELHGKVDQIRYQIGDIALSRLGVHTKNLHELKNESQLLLKDLANLLLVQENPAISALVGSYNTLVDESKSLDELRAAVDRILTFAKMYDIDPELAHILAQLNRVSLAAIKERVKDQQPYPVDLIVNLTRQTAHLERKALVRGIPQEGLRATYLSLVETLGKKGLPRELIQVKLSVLVEQLKRHAKLFPSLQKELGPLNAQLQGELKKLLPADDPHLKEFATLSKQIDQSKKSDIRQKGEEAVANLVEKRGRPIIQSALSLRAISSWINIPRIIGSRLKAAFKDFGLTDAPNLAAVIEKLVPALFRKTALEAMNNKLAPLLEQKQFAGMVSLSLSDLAQIDPTNPAAIPTKQDSQKKIAEHCLTLLKAGTTGSWILDWVVNSQQADDSARKRILDGLAEVNMPLHLVTDLLQMPDAAAASKILHNLLAEVTDEATQSLEETKQILEFKGEDLVWFLAERLLSHAASGSTVGEGTPRMTQSFDGAVNTMRDLLIPRGDTGVVGKSAFKLAEDVKKQHAVLPSAIDDLSQKLRKWVAG